MNTTKIIEINNLVKKYGKEKVLDIDTFSFYYGESYLLIGANGSGKSTLIKLITCLNKKTSGEINIYTNNIGYVPERFIYPPYLSINDFLQVICNLHGKNVTEDEILKMCKFWNLNPNKTLGKLSKGMKQKVLISQSTLIEADLYIFDEPLNGLDEASQNQFLSVLKRLTNLNKCIIVSTHYEKYYADFFKHKLYLIDGKIHES